MQSGIELRRTKRYPLKVPAAFFWALHDGKPQCGLGVTRDINTFGTFVLTDELPPIGALVLVEIVLPKLANTGPGMHLTGEGVVTRREPNGATKRGFAASVQFYPEATESVLSRLKVPCQVV